MSANEQAPQAGDEAEQAADQTNGNVAAENGGAEEETEQAQPPGLVDTAVAMKSSYLQLLDTLRPVANNLPPEFVTHLQTFNGLVERLERATVAAAASELSQKFPNVSAAKLAAASPAELSVLAKFWEQPSQADQQQQQGSNDFMPFMPRAPDGRFTSPNQPKAAKPSVAVNPSLKKPAAPAQATDAKRQKKMTPEEESRSILHQLMSQRVERTTGMLDNNQDMLGAYLREFQQRQQKKK